MGNHDFIRSDMKETDLRTCADVAIVASAKYSASLRSILDAAAFPGLLVMETPAAERIPQGAIANASLAVIEVDCTDPASMQRLAAFRRAVPQVPVIAAIPDASVALVRSLVREGVADVIALPFTSEELLDAGLNVLANQAGLRVSSSPLAPMIAVVRSTGGCGATSIATHLTAILGEGTAGCPVLVDLDLQFGDAGEYLAAEGRGTLADLLDAGERLDDELVQSIVRMSSEGVGVVTAPAEIMPLEMVDTDRLLRVLQLLRRNYSYVVLDLPANWTNWTLSAALSADLVLLVCELSVASLRQAKRRLDLFKTVGIPAEHVAVVVNRIEKRLFRTIGLDDVEDTLRHPVVGSIAADGAVVGSAQDQGRLVGSLHRKSRFNLDLHQLAGALSARIAGHRQ